MAGPTTLLCQQMSLHTHISSPVVMLLISPTANEHLLSPAQAHGLVTLIWFVVLAAVILDGEPTK